MENRHPRAALAGFLPGIMLTQIGYIPNAVQRSETLLGLRQLIFIWPCLLAISAAIIMGVFYKLNEARFAKIIEEIGARKKGDIPRPVIEKEKTSVLSL